MKSSRTVAPWSILLPLALGACVQIVGIEDPLPLDDKPPDGSSSSSSGGSTSSGPAGPWATWHMPNPKDAMLPNPANYTEDTQNNVIIDNVTRLMWQRTVDTGEFTWSEAKTHCENLTLAGYTDWRLPWRIEMASLIDYTKSSPAIDPVFGNGPSDWYWTASPGAYDTSKSWLVYLIDGDVYLNPITDVCAVRCVRSN